MITDPKLFPAAAVAEVERFKTLTEEVVCTPGYSIDMYVSTDNETGDLGVLHREYDDEAGGWGPVTYLVKTTDEWTAA